MIDLAEQRIARIIDSVLAAEGGGTYTNNPTDRGGPTRYGITERTARLAGYTGPMQALPEATARTIYRQQYVTVPGFDQIVAIDPDIGALLVDIGVNMGPARAANFLQRWLNGFNVGGTRYAVLKVDGNAGAVTRDALRAFLRWRGPLGAAALLRAIKGVRDTAYLALAESDPAQRQFLYGWINRGAPAA
ncbi:glycoside hydrolase family 108 protein [Luteibacter mycovicinus]|uniref:glycoside hydrolase family 108 protein n=1 Tax=Luteibacter mycovicinus TaxID=1500890 RepID=UPI000A9DBA17|nr:glycosyl hydrolase 108 family protein [Luteibacter sp. 9143a]